MIRNPTIAIVPRRIIFSGILTRCSRADCTPAVTILSFSRTRFGSGGGRTGRRTSLTIIPGGTGIARVITSVIGRWVTVWVRRSPRTGLGGSATTGRSGRSRNGRDCTSTMTGNSPGRTGDRVICVNQGTPRRRGAGTLSGSGRADGRAVITVSACGRTTGPASAI